MLEVSTGIAKANAMIRCIDVVELQDKITSEEQQIAQHKDELDRLALEMERTEPF